MYFFNQIHISIDNSILNDEEISKVENEIEPDDTSVDTENILEFNEKSIRTDEKMKEINHQNILSHKEIKELTVFFNKQSPIKILEKLDGMRKHVNNLEYSGYLLDLSILDQLKKYLKTKIRYGTTLKDIRRKTISKSIIMISQKMALYRRLSVNQSYSSYWDV
jgi:hypothetical protein